MVRPSSISGRDALTASSVQLRHKTDPRREMTPGFERAGVDDGSNQCSGVPRSPLYFKIWTLTASLHKKHVELPRLSHQDVPHQHFHLLVRQVRQRVAYVH